MLTTKSTKKIFSYQCLALSIKQSDNAIMLVVQKSNEEACHRLLIILR